MRRNGEIDQKDTPKVELGRNRWQNRCQQHGDSKALRGYREPMPGFEKELFPVGLAGDDAVDFEEVRKKLARFARVNFKHGVAIMQKAIEDMIAPSFRHPPDPSTTASPVEIEN